MADQFHEQPVEVVMTKGVVSTHSEDTVFDALALMADKRFSALPVVDAQGSCVGILSSTDVVGLTRDLVERLSDPGHVGAVLSEWLVDKLTKRDTGHRRVAELMTANVVAVSPATTIGDVARQMLRHRVHHLPGP